MKPSNPSIFNLPNQITLLRIAMVPVLMLFLTIPWAYGKLIALIIFLVAALSDLMDGYIARTTEKVTDFGEFIDPIADKLLVTAALLPFVQAGKFWWVWMMVLLAREFIVTGLRILAATQGVVIKASGLAKFKTLSHVVLVVVLIGQDLADWGSWALPIKDVCVGTAVILSIISGWDYFIKSRDILRKL